VVARIAIVFRVALQFGARRERRAKTMGIITGLLYTGGLIKGGNGVFDIPLWVVLSAHAAIALGTLTGGWRIVKTMGTKIAKLKPIDGFCA